MSKKKLEFKVFVWHHNPDVFGDNNDGPLQELLDDGWEFDFMSDPVLKGEKCVSFVSLLRPLDEDEDDEDEDDD